LLQSARAKVFDDGVRGAWPVRIFKVPARILVGEWDEMKLQRHGIVLLSYRFQRSCASPVRNPA
jgi:hypothetical protein